MRQVTFGSPLRKALKSRTAFDLSAASDVGASSVKFTNDRSKNFVLR
jgi:hypothetical protein